VRWHQAARSHRFTVKLRSDAADDVGNPISAALENLSAFAAVAAAHGKCHVVAGVSAAVSTRGVIGTSQPEQFLHANAADAKVHNSSNLGSSGTG
jgi:hypothetical protein